MKLENEYIGVFTGCSEYKQKLNEIIDELFSEVKYRPIEVIIEKVRQVTDEYVIAVGERPDVSALDRMSTLILNGDITDTNRMKMRDTEYPVMSDTQEARRKTGVHQRRGYDSLGEVPLTWAQEIGTDGVDYRPKNRDTNRRIRDIVT